MAFTIKDARGVCSASELELVKLSRSSAAKQETPARLRQKIARARKLRDKFRDESARQAREARGKAAPKGTRASEGNDRTVLKAEVFQDALDRFEAMLIAAETKAEKKTAGAATKRPTSKKKSSKKVSSAAKGEASEGKSSSETKSSGKKVAKKATTKASGKTVAGATAKMSGKKSGRSSAGASLAASPSSPTAAFTATDPVAASRNTRRREHHKDSKAERVESRFAATAQMRLKGHASAQTKRSQARRDSR